MAVKFSNNAATVLAADLTTSATTITVSDGSVFPALSASEHTYVTLEDLSANREVVKVTAISSNTLTVVRGQDGTSARAFSTADKCELRITAALLNDLNTDADTESVSISGDTMTGNLSLGDNVKAQFGAGDLQIYHDASHSYIVNTYDSGALKLKSNDVRIENTAGRNQLKTGVSGAVQLFYDTGSATSVKLATSSTGIDVTGSVVADGLTVDTSATGGFKVEDRGAEGAGVKVTAYQGTTNSNVRQLDVDAYQLTVSTGSVTGTTVTDRLLIADNGNISFFEDTGTTAKLVWNPTSEELQFADNVKATFGAGDLQIYHDPSGPSSLISDQGAGDLILRGSNQIRFQDATGAEHYAIFNENGAVQLYYDNAAKLATTATGIDVTGSVTADSVVVGDTSSSFSAVYVTSSATGESELRLGDTDTDAGSVSYTNSDDTMTFRAAAGARMSLDSSGLDVTGTATMGGLTVSSGAFAGMNIQAGASSLAAIDFGDSADTNIGGINYNNANDTLNLRSGNLNRLTAASNGDISFYNDSAAQGLFWDSSASSLGIGTTAVSSFAINDLVVGSGSTANGMTIYSASTSEGIIRFADGTSGIQQYAGQVKYNHSNDSLNFYTNGSGTSRLALDSSGNATFSGAVTADGLTVDGAGSIGLVATDRLYMATSDGLGIQLDKDNNRIVPVGADGSTYNNNVSLGSSGLEFKNLFLSGAITSTGLTVHSSTAPKITISNGGGTSPNPELEFFRQSGVTARITYEVANKDLVITNDFANGTTQFKHGSSEQMRLSSGNVNIPNGSLMVGSTTAPSYPLQVKKDVNSFVMKVENDGNSAGTSGASYADASDGLWVDTRWNTATNTPFKVTSNSGSTPMMIVKGNGSVGIGTNSPSASVKLQISSGVTDTPTTFRIENTDTTIDTSQEVNAIEFYTNDASAAGTGVSAKIAQVAENPGNQFGLVFSTYDTTLSEAMRIDESGNVGVGTNSPSTYDSRANNLVVGDSGDAGITIFSGASSNARLVFAASGDTGLSNGQIDYDNANDKMAFATGGSDRVAIDSSGNLLVGTTSTTVGSGGAGTIGFRVDGANGIVQAASDGTTAGIFNRTTDDGTILDLRKDGTPVGSIGTEGGDLNIGNGDAGLQFINGTQSVRPFNVTTNARIDAQVDLGMASTRFKNLYLSGGVYANNASGAFLWNASNATIAFGTNNIERARITSDGNFALGTTSASGVRLNVTTPTANHVAAQIENSNTADSFGLIVKAGNDANDYTADFRKRDNTSVMRISGDGNVGIGLTSGISSRLHVNTEMSLGADGDNRAILGYTPSRFYIGTRQGGTNYFDTVSVSGGNVGIGTGTPSAVLTTQTTGALTLNSNDGDHSAFGLLVYLPTSRANTVSGAIGFSGSGGRKYAAIGAQTYADTDQTGLNFYVQPSASGSTAAMVEAMRIDLSGDLIVGGTSSGANDAVSISNTGYIQAIVNGDTVGYFNRRTSDGEILRFQKDGTTVGSIGNSGTTAMYVGSGDTQLLFKADEDQMVPFSAGGYRDGAISLGRSNGRFKDLYLSGKVNATSFELTGTATMDGITNNGDVVFSKSSTGVPTLKMSGFAGANSPYGVINFYNEDGSQQGPNNAVQIKALAKNSDGSGGELAFYTSTGTSSEGADAVERFRIDSSGNLTTRQSTGNNFRVMRFSDNSIEVGNYNATDGYQNTSYISSTHTFYAGTAGAGSASRAVDIDSSGNVGIGVVPSADSYFKSLEIGTIGSGITGRGAADTHFMSGLIWDGASTQEYTVSSVAVGKYQITNGIHYWGTAPAGTAGNVATPQTNMMLDASGNLLVGTTSAVSGSASGVQVLPAGFIRTGRGATTGETHLEFYNPNGRVGLITTAGTTTAYNTSSDQRLKENIADADDAGSKVDAIQVRKFDWKADGQHQDYGMIAQELIEVAPEAVSATEDPDEMMGVDYSKLVPMLIKEIQQLRKRVKDLEEE